jgi:hypothetical protein
MEHCDKHFHLLEVWTDLCFGIHPKLFARVAKVADKAWRGRAVLAERVSIKTSIQLGMRTSLIIFVLRIRGSIPIEMGSLQCPCNPHIVGMYGCVAHDSKSQRNIIESRTAAYRSDGDKPA